ncbi:M15 family metallopeptidase [Nocardioides gilvus]|uniref:M15 family metallopeptidase n=1 Tax=Nocardioides gilvus TaxID=1735589 RepID=UPI000D748763|nr:M15 family metallopeptidase [Nocardioides gilvus]
MRRTLSVLLGAVLIALPVPSMAAEDARTATGTSVSSTSARSGETAPLAVLVTDPSGAGLASRTVRLARWSGTQWEALTTVRTDAAGRASAPIVVDRDPQLNRVRATHEGDASYAPSTGEHRVALVRRSSTLALTAPAEVADESRVQLKVRWSADDGSAVSGPVVIERRSKKGGRYDGWKPLTTVRTDAEGRVDVLRRPRWNTRWRVRAAAVAWAEGSRSPVRATRNVAPGKAVVMPKGAPRPRIKLPAQRRAIGKGANVVVTKIPRKVWRSMVGRSWRKGCPVGRSGLRLVRTNYWAFDGYRLRGSMVVAAGVTSNFVGVFTEMHREKVPVRAMYRVDRFGWSKKLGGADDYRSMAADNTSVFNCRRVVGNPSARSPHSYGRSLDLNPWENPFRSRHGVVPNRWWTSHDHPRVAWRSRSHKVVRMMARHGFRWTYGTGDAHHFDAIAGHRPLKKLLESRACTTDICH